jgi:hypothetical protein
MSSRWQVVFSMLAGFGAAGFTTCDNGPATATLTVEKLVGSCFSPCQGSNSPDPSLGLGSVCSSAGSVQCGLQGGTDQIRITVDYGQQTLTTATGVTAPTAQLIGNGSLLATVTLSLGPLATGVQRPFASTVTYAPSVAVQTLTMLASVGGGDTVALSGLDIAAPTGALSLPGCPAPPAACSLPAQVGTQNVTVTVPANATATTATVQTFVDNVPQGSSLSIPLTSVPGNQLSGTLATPVPASGQVWSFQGYVGSVQLPSQQIALAAPSVSAALQGCSGSPCTVAAGGTASITVTAPKGSEVSSASVTAAINGVDVGSPISVPLATCGGSLCGVQVLTVPASAQVGGTWQAQATVGLYSTNTLTATITPGMDGGV